MTDAAPCASHAGTPPAPAPSRAARPSRLSAPHSLYLMLADRLLAGWRDGSTTARAAELTALQPGPLPQRAGPAAPDLSAHRPAAGPRAPLPAAGGRADARAPWRGRPVRAP